MNEIGEISTWAYVAYVAAVFALGYCYGYVAGKEKVKRQYREEQYRKMAQRMKQQYRGGGKA